MPTYKGNRGNLLQHWVLVELVGLLRQYTEQSSTLCLIDAHAMSPLAVRDPNPGQSAADFDRVRMRLPGQKSRYELAWTSLATALSCDYPNSPAFVRSIWNGPLTLLLCEADPILAHKAAADEQKEYADVVRLDDVLTALELEAGAQRRDDRWQRDARDAA